MTAAPARAAAPPTRKRLWPRRVEIAEVIV